MNVVFENMSTRRASGSQGERIISLATLAVGGQGGGVLTNWIVAVAEANGYHAQSTSVAGVAQRTGSTIYYVEMCRDTGVTPVFTLSPAEKDVDILIASELMEAGRAVLRGFSSPEFTTLIASTHRIAAIGEKMTPGDGRVGPEDVVQAMRAATDKVVAFDMEAIAREAGTVVSSSLLGALAGSGALPFARESYEEVIRASERGVEASLKAFAVAYERAVSGGEIVLAEEEVPEAQAAEVSGPDALLAEWQRLEARLTELPAPAREMARLGLQKVADYQDVAYGQEYLEHVASFAALDDEMGVLTETAAKYVAKAMCYDDVIRVADLKTRATRQRRVEDEVGVKDGQVLHVTEYFHPRFEEFYLGLPDRMGRWVQDNGFMKRLFERRLDKGRRIGTRKLSGFLMLWLLAGMRPMRRKLMRHGIEMAHMAAWLELARDMARENRALSGEVLACHRLIKGYSDTHVRGLTKFDKVIAAAKELRGREDAADWVRRLRTAALDDVEGKGLEDALKTVRSFL